MQQNVQAGNLPASSKTDLDAADSLQAKYKVALDLLDQLQARGAVLAEYDLARTMFGADFETKLRSGVDIIGAMRTALDGIASSGEARIASEQEIANAQRIQAQYAEQNRAIAAAWAPIEQDIALYEQDQLQHMADLRGLYVDVAVAAGKLASYLADAASYITSLGNSGIFKQLVEVMNAHGLITDPEVKRQIDAGKADPPPDAPPLTIRKRPDTSRSLPSLTPTRAPAGRGGSQVDEVDNLIKSLNKAAAAEQGEAAALGLGNKARQEYIDLAKAEEAARERGTALTADERIKVLAAADAYSTAHDKIEAVKRAQDAATEKAKFFGDTFADAIDSVVVKGNSLSDVFLNLAKTLESAALKSALTGGGPLGGLLGAAPAPGASGSDSVGGLLGAILSSVKFASGGQVSGAGTGTSDSIPAMLSHGEYVVNARATRNAFPLLEAINRGHPLRLARGGLVGVRPPDLRSPASDGGRGDGVSIQVVNNHPTGAASVRKGGNVNGRQTFQVMFEDALSHSVATNGRGFQNLSKRSGGGRVGG